MFERPGCPRRQALAHQDRPGIPAYDGRKSSTLAPTSHSRPDACRHYAFRARDRDADICSVAEGGREGRTDRWLPWRGFLLWNARWASQGRAEIGRTTWPRDAGDARPEGKSVTHTEEWMRTFCIITTARERTCGPDPRPHAGDPPAGRLPLAEQLGPDPHGSWR